MLTGCAHWFGPAHGTFSVTGSTPENSTCMLSVGATDAGSAPGTWTVSGDFQQRVLINPSRKGHRVTLDCDGILVAERSFKYGRDVGMGGNLVLEGNAP
jgi:hypothetical protein